MHRNAVPLLAATLALLMVSAPLALGDSHPTSTGIRPDGSSAAAPADAPGPGAPTAERIAEGLNAPVNIAFGPDGTLYYGEWKTGAVYPLGEDGKAVDYGNPVFDVGDPAWGSERGFVGLDVDGHGNFYTFTTYERENGTWFNRLSKWVDGEETILLDNLDAGEWHNAGTIHVDPRDGTLWVAYGDVNKYEVAQDPDDLRGKILHMTPTGEPVEGNIAPDSLVYSLGHRQPYGFAVNWETGQVAAAENMDKKNDEVSMVQPGGNHGWPLCEGPCDPPREDMVDPVVYYPQTIGPTGGVWFAGDFWFGDFNYGQLHRIYQGEDGRWYDEIAHAQENPPILDLERGPEGNTLYFSTWDAIWKLTFDDVDPDPPEFYTGDLPGDTGDNPDDDSGAAYEGDGEGGGATIPAAGAPLALLAALLAARRRRT